MPASVEIGRNGQPPRRIEEVYLRDGVPFVAVEEVLAAVGLRGSWDSVRHVFRFKTPSGTVQLSPDRTVVLLNGRSLELEHPPRFIDGHLRVPVSFISEQLPEILREPVFFRDLNPSRTPPRAEEEGALDRLFSFLLRRTPPEPEGPSLRAIAVDPAHGGDDPGALSPEGEQEKTVVLEVSRSLEKLFKMRLGTPVYLSRDADYAVPAEERLKTAIRPDVDVYLLLHAQAALSPTPHGITLFIRPRDESEGGGAVGGEGESMRLARHLEEAFQGNGFSVLGIVRAPLPGLGRGDLPAVLVELGFLSNPHDRVFLTTPAGRKSLAESLYAGVKAFADQQKETTE